MQGLKSRGLPVINIHDGVCCIFEATLDVMCNLTTVSGEGQLGNQQFSGLLVPPYLTESNCSRTIPLCFFDTSSWQCRLRAFRIFCYQTRSFRGPFFDSSLFGIARWSCFVLRASQFSRCLGCCNVPLSGLSHFGSSEIGFRFPGSSTSRVLSLRITGWFSLLLSRHSEIFIRV